VRAFLDAGAHVAGSSRRIADADFANPRFAAIPADLSNPADAQRLAAECIRRFGRIDALIHVAGGFAGGRPIHETDDATLENMLAVNFRTAFHALRAVIPHMRGAGRGRIVAFGSRAGVEPVATIAEYSASKAALVSLIRTAALENRDLGITANLILPGTIDTEANRKADPNGDRTKWVAPQRLASDAAADITGAAIPVYGRGL
jgi:NAD(P)-dependent dehydrogenase (short-subunit alcohol dehydrogenase family)